MVSAVWSVMLRLLHTVSSSWLPLASMIRRWKRSLCSTVPWTSSLTAAAAIASTSACSALTSSCSRGVAMRAADSSSAPRSS